MSLRWQKRRAGIWFAWDDNGPTDMLEPTLFWVIQLPTERTWFLQDHMGTENTIHETLRSAKAAAQARFNRNRRRAR